MTQTMKIWLAAAAAVVVLGAGITVAAAAPWHRSGYSMPAISGGMMGGGSMMSGGGMMGGATGSMMGPGWAGTESPPAAIAGAREVTVTLDNFRFSPSTIAVKTGEAVNVVLKNTDEVVHDFTLPTLGIHVTVQPGQSTTVGLQPMATGTYPFLCTVAGHAQAGMRGSLTVAA